MHPDIKIGSLFPDFELPDQEGDSLYLEAYMSGRPAILTFVRGYY